jgi:hypothetical protein
MYLWADRSIEQVQRWPCIKGDRQALEEGVANIRRILTAQPSPLPQHAELQKLPSDGP